MTKLSTIPQHQLSITCGLCKHHTMLEVANLIAVVGGDTTAHEVRQRAFKRCIVLLTERLVSIGYLCSEDTLNPQLSKS